VIKTIHIYSFFTFFSSKPTSERKNAPKITNRIVGESGDAKLQLQLFPTFFSILFPLQQHNYGITIIQKFLLGKKYFSSKFCEKTRFKGDLFISVHALMPLSIANIK
jgi:hypothetical protein